MEQSTQLGQQWLENLLELMGFSAKVIVENRKSALEEVEECWLTIEDSQLTAEQITSLIGERGQSIDAIQYLANTLINLSVDTEQQQGFTVELNGYRFKRQEELKTWTQQVAEQVRQTGQEVEMTSLSSAERRQIHTFLQDSEDLETESRGQEPERRLVIKPR